MGKYILLIGFLLVWFFSFSQSVGINNTGANPNAFSILDVDISSNNKGVLIPRITSAQRNAIAGMGASEEGLTVYDETTNSFWFWSGSAWVEIANNLSGSGGIYSGDGTAPAGVDVTITDYVNFDANTLYVNGSNNNIGIGTAPNASSKLHVNGIIYGGNRVYLDRDGSGNSWIGAQGTGTDAQRVAIGLTSAAGTGIIGEIKFNVSGGQRIAITPKSQIEPSNNGNSIFIGTQAGENDDLTDNRNVFIGHLTGFSNTSGNENTSVGYQSAYSNTNGTFNTAIGSSSFRQALSFSDQNTVIGYQAMHGGASTFQFSDNNVAIGYRAMYHVDNSSTGNVAIGHQSLFSITSAGSNTSIGLSALRNATSASSNTAIGTYAGELTTTGGNNTIVGWYALRPNTVGTYNTSIGLASGNNGNNNNYCTYLGYTSRNSTTASYTNSTAVGNGSTITASHQVRLGNTSVTSIGGYANWTNLSDARYKKEIKEDVPGLDFILKIQPVTYKVDFEKLNSTLYDSGDSIPPAVWNNRSDEVFSGFLAQDIEAIAASIDYDFSGVDEPNSDADHYGLRYADFIPALVQSIKELNALIDLQNEKIIQLEKTIKTIQEK